MTCDVYSGPDYQLIEKLQKKWKETYNKRLESLTDSDKKIASITEDIRTLRDVLQTKDVPLKMGEFEEDADFKQRIKVKEELIKAAPNKIPQLEIQLKKEQSKKETTLQNNKCDFVVTMPFPYDIILPLPEFDRKTMSFPSVKFRSLFVERIPIVFTEYARLDALLRVTKDPFETCFVYGTHSIQYSREEEIFRNVFRKINAGEKWILGEKTSGILLFDRMFRPRGDVKYGLLDTSSLIESRGGAVKEATYFTNSAVPDMITTSIKFSSLGDAAEFKSSVQELDSLGESFVNEKKEAKRNTYFWRTIEIRYYGCTKLEASCKFTNLFNQKYQVIDTFDFEVHIFDTVPYQKGNITVTDGKGKVLFNIGE
ncbi:MAG: hypothetical protein LBU65_01015 [Planctomycetaceae bacterium]|jgi:hypothetical protein|nr:hypothetical protein [Planctomycetaceae bacterium]